MEKRVLIFSTLALMFTSCIRQHNEPTLEVKGEKIMRNTELTLKAKGFIEGMLKPKQNTPIISSPKDFDVDFEEVMFKTQDNVMLSAWLLKGKTTNLIIQAHPVTTNRSGYGQTEQLKTAKAFVDAGFSVLMFDARNHGKSEQGDVPYAIGSIDDAPDFVAAVDYISSYPGFKNANIGIHAQCFGVNATTHAFGLKDGLQSRKNLKAISLTQPASWGMLMRPSAGDAFVDEVNKQLEAKGVKDLDATPLIDASKINVPTLVVQNINDPSGTLPFVKQFYNTIATEKELWMIDGEKDRSFAYYYETTNPENLVAWFSKTLR